ncbi:MAG: type 1 glutamine amidotransferase [Bacteroidales bacterium]|nr:type 1 glutamine amidotransferase [Bacteroidales bacterium]
MKIAILQHVPFEKPGYFLDIFYKYQAMADIFYAWEPDGLPEDIQDHDILLIMGGPMNIYEEDRYPWLKKEKALILSAIENGKVVIGVCLGAQLIAHALGASVYKNITREIGWFPVQKTNDTIFNFLPDFATVFHWHGECFDVPNGGISFYKSEITRNQAFMYQDRVLAIQFHIEMNVESGFLLCENCKDELEGSEYVMSENEIIEGFSIFSDSNKKMLRNMISWLLKRNRLIR